jgi:hypothetical protein
LAQAKEGMELDSPLSKMLDFLQRYQCRRLWGRPSANEAAELQDMIVSHFGPLSVPDLESKLTSVTEPFKRFLLNLQPRAQPRIASNASNTSARTLPSTSCGNASNDSNDASLSGEVTAAAPPTAHPSSHAVVTVHESLRSQIPWNFFLDVITPDSPLSCPSPLVIVVKQCIDSLRLLKSKEASKRMMHFATLVNEGHPATGCMGYTRPASSFACVNCPLDDRLWLEMMLIAYYIELNVSMHARRSQQGSRRGCDQPSAGHHLAHWDGLP